MARVKWAPFEESYRHSLKRGEPMSRFKKLSHAIWYSHYHIVWSPKYRYRLFNGQVKQEVEHYV